MQILIDYDLAIPVMALAWLVIGLLLGMRLRPSRRGYTVGGAPRPGISPAARTRGGPVELYVGNLAPETKDAALRTVFEAFGSVQSVRILSGQADGVPKVFAFVTMASAAAAEKAIQSLHGKTVEGRALVVNEARSPRRRGGRR